MQKSGQMPMKTIPYGSQWVDDNDINAVCAVLKGDWLTQGPLIEQFEDKIAKYAGTRYAVAFNSGTSALHGAMFAAGVSSGDEVITTPISFVATPNSAVYLGGIPVFVDIDPATYCINTQLIEHAITDRTKVIAPVDMAGYPMDMREIRDIADRHDLVIVEDAAHALGGRRYGMSVGKEADMTMFSFHPVKHITTGEGGIIVTDSDEYTERLRLLRSHGTTKDPKKLTRNEGSWYYEMQELGYNYRITDIQCALGISQFSKLEGFITRRNEIADAYDQVFQDLPGIIIPPRPRWPDSRHAFHIYPIQCTGCDRKGMMSKLKEQGILTQVHYIPIHQQPYYQNHFGFREGQFPHAENYYHHELSLPIFPRMDDEDVNRVISAICKILGVDGS
ncbi:MAG: UDP-4-amino-4,6-dideoxy-N-acetyl-beta-L-altrosamine transaminase [Methanoregula sp.]|nr:UDP-4-amino-4,6-dideoxy-N-acetyl-beta-L-altrosamine transaminase [Methanoregula sp.]